MTSDLVDRNVICHHKPSHPQGCPKSPKPTEPTDCMCSPNKNKNEPDTYDEGTRGGQQVLISDKSK